MATLLTRKRQLELGRAPDPARASIGLPQGAIRDAVLEVLTTAPGALRAKEIQARTVQRLGIAVSYDTVASYLSVACRAVGARVVRVGYGRYRLEIDGEARRTPDREASGPSSSIGG